MKSIPVEKWDWDLMLLRYAEKVGTEEAPEERKKVVLSISQALQVARIEAKEEERKRIAEEVDEYGSQVGHCSREEQLEGHKETTN